MIRCDCFEMRLLAMGTCKTMKHMHACKSAAGLSICFKNCINSRCEAFLFFFFLFDYGVNQLCFPVSPSISVCSFISSPPPSCFASQSAHHPFSVNLLRHTHQTAMVACAGDIAATILEMNICSFRFFFRIELKG